jgi:hypothetical protein
MLMDEYDARFRTETEATAPAPVAPSVHPKPTAG